MSNVTFRPITTQFRVAMYANGCNVIKPTNTSFANWENIPETLGLNLIVSIVLFILFLIFSRLAWRNFGHDEKIHNQNIIHFLYGYRDPEHWYVIPRYEFLRAERSHHQHDLDYPYLYIPPKLPLANPIEILAIDSLTGPQHSKSSELGKHRTLRTTSSKMADLAKSSSLNRKPAGSLTSPKPASLTGAHGLPGHRGSKSSSSHGLGPHRHSSKGLSQSFIYPSILTAEQSQASYLSRKLNRLFSMFFTVTDADIIYARGIDAYEYLLFQRHLIFIMIVANILCLGVILPIHWFAGTGVNPNIIMTTSFQRTTIKNMNAISHFHWAHIVCCIIILSVCVISMNSYNQSITTRDETQLSRRTLLIGNIPPSQRKRSNLVRIFLDNFARINIEGIQFVYDFSVLYDYESYLSSAIVAKEYCREYKAKYNKELMIHKTDVNSGRYCDGYCRLCSFCYVSCFYWTSEETQPGSEYYAQEERMYREKIVKACEKLLKEPTEYAFVTFRTNKQARRVMEELALLKQEALEGRQETLARIKSRASQETMQDTVSVISSASADNQGKVQTNLVDTSSLDDAPEKSQLKLAKAIKFIEAGNVHSDPLNPTNDPHIRSIRSPGVIYKRRPSESGKRPDNNGESSSKGRQSAEKRVKFREPSSPDTIGQYYPKSNLEDSPLLWSVRYAPHPDNVEFNDLRYLARVSKYTGALLNLLMILFFIFITTPNVLLSMIERIAIINPDRVHKLTGYQGIAINYFSILLQVMMTALLPSLVLVISRQIPYEDTSSKNHSVMWKVYLFLVLMVIVMPSIGMSNAQALFVSDIDPKCLFPTDNGAYYINYMISSTFLSSVSELIKPTDILYYYFILWTSRSTAEIEGGRQFIEREFSVGLQHTTVLLSFSVVMTYLISCPLIAPAGLVYLIVKHSVDHYHLYYVYFTKKVDKSMQSTIVIFVKVAVLLMLFQTSISITLSTGTSYFSLISQIIFWITVSALAFNSFFNCTSGTLPAPGRSSRFRQDYCACYYLPRVIENLLRLNAIPGSFVSRKV